MFSACSDVILEDIQHLNNICSWFSQFHETGSVYGKENQLKNQFKKQMWK
jgi:hypothetical protein